MLGRAVFMAVVAFVGINIMISVVLGLCLYIAGNHVIGTITIFGSIFGPVVIYGLIKTVDHCRGKHFS